MAGKEVETMKHFEDIWAAAEELQDTQKPEDRAEKLVGILQYLIDGSESSENPMPQETREELVSDFMFQVTGLFKDLNMNSAAALKKAINEAKIDKYG